jgi:Kef-type K+ transport system membrane component KefB
MTSKWLKGQGSWVNQPPGKRRIYAAILSAEILVGVGLFVFLVHRATGGTAILVVGAIVALLFLGFAWGLALNPRATFRAAPRVLAGIFALCVVVWLVFVVAIVASSRGS